MNKPSNASPARQAPGKETPAQKWFFIFRQGCLYWAVPIALLSSILIQLSYTSFEFNEAFLNKLPERLFLNLLVLSASGCGLGHWRWSYHNHKPQVNPS